MDLLTARRNLVRHLSSLGIDDPGVLRAIAEVPREAFLPPELEEFAYDDTALPIGEGQTISQPFIVALMAAAAEIGPGDRVLEVGTGSGYAAAVLGRIASEVFSIERHESLAETAHGRLEKLGFDNVHVLHGDGTLGWKEHAPYDAILVAAGGPEVPAALSAQLAHGGRLVIPVGDTPRAQRLVRWTRTDGRFLEEDLGGVRFVPLIGRAGWRQPEADSGHHTGSVRPVARAAPPDHTVVQLLREAAEPFGSIESADLGSLTERVADARVVLIGEATHGTSEFYRMRARITQELIERHGFSVVAIEGDWPDVARLHRWARGEAREESWTPFSRFPTWMWRNRETEAFVAWLREWNQVHDPDQRAGIFGLDLYSMGRSIQAVLGYLDRVDPDSARIARERYGCLTPWQRDPSTYGRAALTGRYRLCENEVAVMLEDLLAKQLDYMARDASTFLDAVSNARLVADAEQYYRIMYRGGHTAWNLRDAHMFETLLTLLAWHGERSKAVVWAHNSHVGNAAATEMGAQGQRTIGAYARDQFGPSALLIGFGTDHGTVAAATDWDGPMEIKTLVPARTGSYEALCHRTDHAAFLMHLREPVRAEVREELGEPRLERAVGVIYRPDTELQSHYFQASLPDQFDAWIWFDETGAVDALPAPSSRGVPDTYPFGV